MYTYVDVNLYTCDLFTHIIQGYLTIADCYSNFDVFLISGFDYDSVFTKVGEFGRFQRILYALSLIVYMNTGLDILGYVFVSTLPDHWCAIPEVDGLNLTEEERKWISLPDAGEDNGEQFRWVHIHARKKTVGSYNLHYNDVIMSPMASQITSLTIVYTIVYSGTNQRQHQSSASLAFVRGIRRWPVNSPRKGPVTRKMLPFDDVIMGCQEDEPATPLTTTNRWWDAIVFSWEMHNGYLLDNKITTTVSIR